MTQYSGETGEGLAAARAALAVRDRALAAADRQLVAVLGEAHRSATSSIRRIEAVQSALCELGAGSEMDTHARARLLLERNRELGDIVTAARETAVAKTTELQRISASYVRSRR